jgi:hypothetical protein
MGSHANCRLGLKTRVPFGQMAGAWVGTLHGGHRSVDCGSTAEVEDTDCGVGSGTAITDPLLLFARIGTSELFDIVALLKMGARCRNIELQVLRLLTQNSDWSESLLAAATKKRDKGRFTEP